MYILKIFDASCTNYPIHVQTTSKFNYRLLLLHDHLNDMTTCFILHACQYIPTFTLGFTQHEEHAHDTGAGNRERGKVSYQMKNHAEI